MHCETTFTARPFAFEAIEFLDKTTVQGGSSLCKADGFIPRMPDSLDSNPYCRPNGNKELERQITKPSQIRNLRNTELVQVSAVEELTVKVLPKT